MANPSDEQGPSSLYPNPLSVDQTDDQQILNLQADTLFLKLTQFENKLKHYNNLKKNWNRCKYILRYSKYPIDILFAGADVELAFIPIVGIPFAIISTTVKLEEVIGANILEDSFVNVKVIIIILNVNLVVHGLIECTYFNKIFYVKE